MGWRGGIHPRCCRRRLPSAAASAASVASAAFAVEAVVAAAAAAGAGVAAAAVRFGVWSLVFSVKL